MAVPFVFHRPDLARRMAEVALGIDPLGGSSGLFLAAPRRTGKSTFLTVDLLPELRRRGAVPVYADLWSDRTRDPAAIILEAVRTALRDTEGGLSRAARRGGVAKVGLGSWLSIDLGNLGSPDGATVPQALAELAKRTGRPRATLPCAIPRRPARCPVVDDLQRHGGTIAHVYVEEDHGGGLLGIRRCRAAHAGFVLRGFGEERSEERGEERGA